jgi:hypothetical protein
VAIIPKRPKKDLALRQQVIRKSSKQEKIWQKKNLTKSNELFLLGVIKFGEIFKNLLKNSSLGAIFF